MSRSPATPGVALRPEAIRRALFGVMVVLVSCHLILLFVRLRYGLPREWGPSPLFHLSDEGNAPAWFSSMLLLGCGVLLAAIAGHPRAGRPLHWGGLAIVFLGLSLDEAASFHERVTFPLQAILGIEGGRSVFHNTWVLAAIPLVLLLGIVYVRFLLELPKPHRTRFLIAGALYLTAVLGVEMVGGAINSLWGGGDELRYQAAVVLEEGLEMSGLIVFLHALLGFMGGLDAVWAVRPTNIEARQARSKA